MDQLVQAAEFIDGPLAVRGRIREMLEAVDDHPELRAPIAEMIVADDAMAQETQRPTECVANHGGANVAHVHRLGHIGRRIVDHITSAGPPRG